MMRTFRCSSSAAGIYDQVRRALCLSGGFPGTLPSGGDTWAEGRPGGVPADRIADAGVELTKPDGPPSPTAHESGAPGGDSAPLMT
jgi:hypothetical protein